MSALIKLILYSDYRKLTFYYYAEEYINFNELVTDLFKVYKTRIWMSAINPASFNGNNPNTGHRIQQWPRMGPAAATALLSPQSQYGAGPSDLGRNRSPVDRDGPAARGDREYNRIVRNGAYDPRRMPFSPNAPQFTPFNQPQFYPQWHG